MKTDGTEKGKALEEWSPRQSLGGGRAEPPQSPDRLWKGRRRARTMRGARMMPASCPVGLLLFSRPDLPPSVGGSKMGP